MKGYLFFDLDGTISDPAEGICSSVIYALKKGGYEAKPLEAYHSWIGPPLVPSFMQELGVDEEEAFKLVLLYREYFADKGIFQNTVYSGIPDMLRSLKASGRKLLIVTGKPTVYAERIAEYFGVADCFEKVCGIPLENESMTKEQTLNEALDYLGTPDLARCMMIGDRRHDIEAGHACGMESAYVLYGYGNEDEAASCRADYIFPTVEALSRFLLN